MVVAPAEGREAVEVSDAAPAQKPPLRAPGSATVGAVGRLLSWLGLQTASDYPNLDALLRELKRALPDDESVILRYIAIVIALLGKVAYADGRFTEKEEQTLRGLLAHI